MELKRLYVFKSYCTARLDLLDIVIFIIFVTIAQIKMYAQCSTIDFYSEFAGTVFAILIF